MAYRLVAAMLMLAVSLYAQYDIGLMTRPPIRVFNGTNGPPNMSVYSVSEDNDGRLWVGTQDGAAFFNGYVWSTFLLPPSSSSKFIRAIVQTPDGTRWFGTEGAGLWSLRKNEWHCHNVQSGFSSNFISSLTVVQTQGSKEFSLWVSTMDSGVALYNSISGWTYYKTEHGLPSNKTWKVKEIVDRVGRTSFYAATNKGLAVFDGAKWVPMTGPGWPNSEVNDITIIHKPNTDIDEVWVSAWGVGMLHYDGLTWTTYSPPNKNFSSYFPITSLAVPDIKGDLTLWVCTYDQGLGWFKNGKWRFINTDTGLPSNGIYSIFAPRNRRPTLWMGMRGGGLASLDLTGWFIVDTKNGLPSNEAHSFAETTKPKRIWIGTSNGLAYYDEAPKVWKYHTIKDGLPHYHVATMLTTYFNGKEELWAGTMRGLARFDAATNTWKTIINTHGPWERVLSLAASYKTNTLYIGTEHGLLSFSVDNGKKQEISPGAISDAPPLIYALAVTQNKQGVESLWVGTRGAWVYRLENGRWTIYKDGSGLLNSSIYCLKEGITPSGKRWLWAATFGGGIARFILDNETGKWESYGSFNTPGVTSDVFARIDIDGLRRVYAVSQRGVVRFSFGVGAASASVETFTTGDGLPTTATNYGASFIDSKERYWVSTNSGVAVLVPQLEIPPAPLPGIILDNVKIANSSITELGPREITLYHHQNSISFDFSIPTFYRAEDARYRTQLMPVETEPTAWSAETHKEFRALAPGRYTLKVEAKDHLGREAIPREFDIKIMPPIYYRWYAYLTYAFITLIAGVTIYRRRIRRYEQHQEELERQILQATMDLHVTNEALIKANENKDNFMGIAAHDLRNPLSGVLMASQEIAHGELELDDAVRFGRMINTAANQMNHLIQNLLDVNKIDSGGMTVELSDVHLLHLVHEVIQHFVDAAASKNIEFKVDVPDDVVVLSDILHLKEVFENLISNSIKYTNPAGFVKYITIKATPDGSHVRVDISDQGLGFSEADKAKAFGRFARLSARPTGGETSTGLGLSIVKALVEAMGGRISLESDFGKGSTFTLYLPNHS